MTIIDLGIYFDGKCALCRDWINPGQEYTQLPEAPEGVPHRLVHPACIPTPHAKEHTNAA